MIIMIVLMCRGHLVHEKNVNIVYRKIQIFYIKMFLVANLIIIILL